MKELLATIQDADIIREYDSATNEERVTFTADMDIDCDGSGGNPHHDPCFQPDTTLHYHGTALNAELEPYVVVPPVVCKKTKGKVLGSLCIVTNTRNHRTAAAVVGDIGPTRKVGEASPALAVLLGINPNPNTGGEDEFVVRYEIHVGKPAFVNGRLYELQSYG